MKLLSRMSLLAATVSLAACVPSTAPAPVQRPTPAPPQQNVPRTDPAPPSVGFIPPQIQRMRGLEDVIGRDAAGLQRLFGQPRLRTPEGDAMKLQFRGEPCVLDIYLYPLRPGAEAVATHTEARRASDGAEVDRASCVRALRRN